MDFIRVSYTQFKEFCITRLLAPQLINNLARAKDDFFGFECTLSEEDIGDLTNSFSNLNNVLEYRDLNGRHVAKSSPFKSKEIEGKSLFKRVHGVIKNCSDSQINVFEFMVPYAHVKLNMLQLVWQPPGCTVNVKVLDTDSGLVQQSMGVANDQIVPKLSLNQFAYNAGIGKDNCVQHSEYDADIYGGMYIIIELTYPSGVPARDICINFGLNELK